MPFFWLSGAPASFQRLMDRSLQGCEEFAAAYIDDFVIFSCKWKEHLVHLQTVLTRLQSAGLTVKLNKSKFAYTSCEYLGHIVGNGVIKPVLAFPRPETKTAVRTFLGLTGYYRRFMPNFVSVAVPLTDLTKKSVPNLVVWNDECEDRALEWMERLKENTQCCADGV